MTLEIAQDIDEQYNRLMLHGHGWLTTNKPNWIKDIIPAYSSITLIYDPLLLLQLNRAPIAACTALFEKMVLSAYELSGKNENDMVKEIPVCYHPSLAPDLEAVAAMHNMSIETLISLHSNTQYRVYMNGFLPGFAYMGIVNERIVTPRLKEPRTSVPAGSVGIAGKQTGIYPIASPGGWQIIGRTPMPLLNLQEERPCILEPGNIIQFNPIDLDLFNNWPV